MPLPLVAFFPWLVGLFASVFGSLLTWIVTKFAAEKAMHIVIVSGFLTAAFTLMVGMALAAKMLVLGVRVTMPDLLGNSTYFLPSNINVIMAAYFTLRVSHYLYRVSTFTLAAYIKGMPGTPP